MRIAAVAELAHGAHVVGDEDDRGAALLERVEVVEALALEGRVADGQDLVDEQDVGPGAGGHREGDAHLHARRVVLELLVHVVLELGEGDDVVVHLVHLAPSRSRAVRR